MNLKTGDIVLVHTPFNWKRPLTILSHLIRLFTKSFWNHAASIVEIWGINYIVESDINGVTILPYKDWVKNQTITVFRVPFVNKKEFSVRSMSKVGFVKYDFKGLLFYGPISLITNKWYGKSDERKAAKRFFCSEKVAWDHEFPNWYSMRPNQLFNYCSKKFRKIHSRIHASELI